MDKSKEFLGEVSFTGSVSFSVNAETIEEAKESVFRDIESIDIKTSEGSLVDIEEIQWEMVDKRQRGNISEPFIYDFYIEEEKENS